MVERLDNFKDDKKQIINNNTDDSKVRRIMNPNDKVRRIVNDILNRE